MVYALDTNIVIRCLRQDPGVKQHFEDAYLQGNDFVLPKVVDYEMRRGFRITSAFKKEAAYAIFTDEINVAEVDDVVWEKAEEIYAELYKKHYTVGEMDILIAATCLANDYTLVTCNTKDFENIDGLEMVDWTI